MSSFASVVIDVDSTLCGVEGIDFLAERRGPEISARISALTDQAMEGEIALESVYAERLTMVDPTPDDLLALAEAYVNSVAPDAPKAIAAMRAAGVRLTLISGGIREAIAPAARQLGFSDHEIHAVSIRFSSDGQYLGVDEPSPLATQRGKPEVVSRLIETGRLLHPVLGVGDGATDAMLVGVVDKFAAYTGFARRLSVVARADLEIAGFEELRKIVLGSRG